MAYVDERNYSKNQSLIKNMHKYNPRYGVRGYFYAMTYTSKTTQKTNDTHTPREVSPAGFTPLTEAELEKNGLINCAPQRARLAQLHNSAAMIGLDGPADQQAKLTTAIAITLKGLEIIDSINAKRTGDANRKGTSKAQDGITDAEFHDDIRAICELRNKVPPEGYKPGSQYREGAEDAKST